MLPRVTTVDDPSTARCDVPVTGMTCASCAARLESGLSGLAGVHEVHVNFVTRRARVTYDPARTGPASFAAAAADLGYAVPTCEASDPDADEQRELLPRLVLAVVLTIPVVAISMVPGLQFGGWEWVAFALSTPVILWSAWPFHRATLRNLRHRTTTMDTLVSLGTIAAYVWSVVALVFLGAGEQGMSVGAVFGGGGDGPHVYFETAAAIVTLLLLGKWFEAWRGTGPGMRSGPSSSSGRRAPASRTATGSRRPTCGWATGSSSGPVSRSRPTAPSSTAPRPSTSPCSPGSRCRSTSSPATRCSARR